MERWPSVKVQLYQLLLINFDCLINYIAFTSERQPLERMQGTTLTVLKVKNDHDSLPPKMLFYSSPCLQIIFWQQYSHLLSCKTSYLES